MGALATAAMLLSVATRAELADDDSDEPGAWHSASGQDRFIVALLDGQRDGFFVDVGSDEPVRQSNTRALERDYGWHGLCIEADAAKVFALARRRTCSVVGAIVSGSVDQVALAFVPAGTHPKNASAPHHDGAESDGSPARFIFSHLVHNRSAAEAERAEQLLRRAGGRVDHGHRTTTLATILTTHRAPPVIDYLSLSLGSSALEEAGLIPLLLDGRHSIRALTLSARASSKLSERLVRVGLHLVESVRFGEAGQLWVHEALRSDARARTRQPLAPVPMGVRSGHRVV